MGRGRVWRASCLRWTGGRSRRWRGCRTQTWTASGRLLNSTDYRGLDGGAAGRTGKSVRKGRIGVMLPGSRDAGIGWRGGRSGSWIPRPRSATTKKDQRRLHRSPPGLVAENLWLERKDGFGGRLLGRFRLREGRIKEWDPDKLTCAHHDDPHHDCQLTCAHHPLLLAPLLSSALLHPLGQVSH